MAKEIKNPVNAAMGDWMGDRLYQAALSKPDGTIELGNWYITEPGKTDAGGGKVAPYSDWLNKHGWSAMSLHRQAYNEPRFMPPSKKESVLDVAKRILRPGWPMTQLLDMAGRKKGVGTAQKRGEDPLINALGKVAFLGMKGVVGAGLHTPELLFGPDLAERVHGAITGFEVDARTEVAKGFVEKVKRGPTIAGAGDFIEFVGGLRTAGALMRPLVGMMPVGEATRLTTGGGATFMLRNLSEQTVDQVNKGKPLDKWSLLAETVIGAVSGGIQHGGRQLSRLYRWFKHFKDTPIGKKVPRRVWFKMDEALRAAYEMPVATHTKTYAKDIGNFARTVSDASRSIQPQLPPGQVGFPSGGPVVPGSSGFSPSELAPRRATEETLYRGGAGALVFGKQHEKYGMSFSVERDIASEFGDVKRYTLSPNAKVYQMTEAEAVMERERVIEDPVTGEAAPMPIIAKAKNLGYDAIDMRVPQLKGEMEIRVINPDVIVPVVITPQRTQLAKSNFKEWATNYAATRARDLGVRVVPTDTDLQESRLKNLKSIARVQERYSKKRENAIEKSTGKPNYLNPWVSARYMWMDFEKRTGIPISHLTTNVYREAGAAHLAGYKAISDKIGLHELGGLTPQDNEHMSKWLFSAETRADVEGDISPQALTVAMKLEDILQGPEARQVQEMVFRRWSKTNKPPADIWQYTNAHAIANNWAIGENANDLAGLINKAMRKMPKDMESLRKQLASAYKSMKNKLSADEQVKFASVVQNGEFLAEVDSRYYHPDEILQAGTKARSEGKLTEWINGQPNWGTRKFYYMSDPMKRDIIDDYLDSMSLNVLDAPQLATDLPGTLSYESRARKGKPPIKEGSVVNNVLTHVQRIRIANAVADDLELLYDRLGQVELTEQDKRVTKQMFNNLMMKRQVTDAPFEAMAEIRRAYWRPTMSWLWRPHTALWRSLRNAVQNPALGPYAASMEAGAKVAAKFGASWLQGRTLEDYDPEMMKRFEENFYSYVSQRQAYYHEFLLQDTANISRDFSHRTTARRAIALMEKTGGLYGMVDEFVNRMPLWLTQYQVVKEAANDYMAGKIDSRQFFKTTKLEMVDETQQMLAEDMLELGKVDDLAAEAANWMTENVNLKYKTPERAGVEQTMDERALLGIYTFPRGVMELVYRQGIRPMLRGVEEGDWGKAYRGARNVIHGTISSSLASALLHYYMGRRAYSVGQTLAYTMLDPGTGTVHGLFEWTWMQSLRYANKEQTLVATVDNIAEAWLKVGETLIVPLSVELENWYESETDKAGANIYRLVRNALVAKLFGKQYVKKLPNVTRTQKQALIHTLVGGYEYVPSKKKTGPEVPRVPTVPKVPEDKTSP